MCINGCNMILYKQINFDAIWKTMTGEYVLKREDGLMAQKLHICDCTKSYLQLIKWITHWLNVGKEQLNMNDKIVIHWSTYPRIHYWHMSSSLATDYFTESGLRKVTSTKFCLKGFFFNGREDAKICKWNLTY